MTEIGRTPGRTEENRAAVSGRRWLYLITASAGMLFAGIIYAWSIMKTPLSGEFGWTPQQLSLNYTISLCCFCLASLAAGILSKKLSVRVILTAGGAMIAVSLILMAGLHDAGPHALYLCYGVLLGSGVGLCYNTLISVGNAWFPDKKGFSAGLMMMCLGFSTMVLGTLASTLMETPGIGWRKTYIGLGIAIFAVLLLCAFILKKPGADVKLPEAPKKQHREDFEPRDYTAAETIRRPSFWLFYLYGLLASSVGSTVIGYARELSISLGAAAQTAAALVGVLSVFNGLGRIMSGICYDRLGRRFTMLFASAATMAAPALMLAAIAAHSLPLSILSFCLTGISYGCMPTISSAFVASFYGMKDFALNFSIGNTKLLFSSFAATAATALMVSTGGYTAPFQMLLALAAAAFVLGFFIRKP